MSKKLEDQHLKILKSLQQSCEANKKCFECQQRGPTYIDVTIGSFVCTSCGGILRGINPPHRVKSISMATFSSAEIALIQKRGNEFCTKVYLGKYDARSKAQPDLSSGISKLRKFMEEKYERKRWYVSPEEIESKIANESKTKLAKLASQATANKPLNKNLSKKATVPLPKAKPQIENVIDDFADFNVKTGQDSNNVNFKNDFADFDTAFSQSTSQQSFDPFKTTENSSQQVLFQNTAQHPNVIVQSPPKSNITENINVQPKKNDRYADLGNLFNLESQEPAIDSSSSKSNGLWDSMFMTSAPSQSNNGTTSVFDNVSSKSQVSQGFNNEQPVETNPTENFYTGSKKNLFETNNQSSVFGVSPNQVTMQATASMQPPPYGYQQPNPLNMVSNSQYLANSASQPVSNSNPFFQTPQPHQLQTNKNPFMIAGQQDISAQPQPSSVSTNPFMTQSSFNNGSQFNTTSTNPFF